MLWGNNRAVCGKVERGQVADLLGALHRHQDPGHHRQGENEGGDLQPLPSDQAHAMAGQMPPLQGGNAKRDPRQDSSGNTGSLLNPARRPRRIQIHPPQSLSNRRQAHAKRMGNQDTETWKWSHPPCGEAEGKRASGTPRIGTRIPVAHLVAHAEDAVLGHGAQREGYAGHLVTPAEPKSSLPSPITKNSMLAGTKHTASTLHIGSSCPIPLLPSGP